MEIKQFEYTPISVETGEYINIILITIILLFVIRMRKSNLVICQHLLKKVFDMLFIEKGNFNRPMEKSDDFPNVSSIRCVIRCLTFHRCTVGF